VADFDQPGSGNPPADGVDDETFARAVGLDQQETERRAPRKRKISDSTSGRSSKGEKKRTREKPVVRRPPVSEKHDDESRIIKGPEDTGVVPLVEAATPPAIEAPIHGLIEQIPPVPVETQEPILLPEEELGWLGRRRARVRRTRRTIRHIDPWSVLKVSVLLYACLYGATVIAGYLLWTAAVQSGVISNIESFIAEVGSYEVWEINGDEIFRRATVIGAVLFVAGVAFNVLLTIIFNLISDLVGGVRVTLLEEDQPPS
tara:strand:- start:25991 stop:26767 length:777 start_codon:yes stop_codon:yes gene_type:complete